LPSPRVQSFSLGQDVPSPANLSRFLFSASHSTIRSFRFLASGKSIFINLIQKLFSENRLKNKKILDFFILKAGALRLWADILLTI